MTINIIGIFDNANAKSNGTSSMRFKFPLSEIGKWSQLLLLINREVKAKVIVDVESTEGAENLKDNSETSIKLGAIVFKSLSVDKDGEAKFTVEGNSDTMDLSMIYAMLDKEIKLVIKAPDTAQAE